MQQKIPYDSYCLDPSCFTSVQNLQATFNILGSLGDYVNDFTIYIPSKIYDVITLPPEAKFPQLRPLIQDWIEDKEVNPITTLNSEKQMEYVDITRSTLESFKIQSFSFISKGDDRIGTETIYLKDLVSRFGNRVAELLFEEIKLCSELREKIICFGQKTIQLLMDFGISIKEARSDFKRIIKDKTKVKKYLQ